MCPRLTFLTISLVILFVNYSNGQAVAESGDKKLESTLSPIPTEIVVDSDLQSPILRAVQQVLANGGGRRRSGGSGGRRRNRKNRSPAQKYYKPLLRALKREDRHELKDIVRADISKAQIAEKVQKWVGESEDAKTKEAFGLFKQERELMKKLKLIGEQNFLEDKSDEAKDLYKKLKQLKEDQALTWDETCTRRNELLKKSDHGTVEELRGKGRPCYRNDSYDRSGTKQISN